MGKILSPLATLIELAEQASDEATAKLGSAIRACKGLEEKLEILKNYREEYASRMQAELKAGREMQHIRNFQLFMGKIDDAIGGQCQLIINARKRIQIEQENWQAQERKRMSYLTLEERAEKVRRVKEARHEQLQNDEYGIRQLFYK